MKLLAEMIGIWKLAAGFNLLIKPTLGSFFQKRMYASIGYGYGLALSMHRYKGFNCSCPVRHTIWYLGQSNEYVSEVSFKKVLFGKIKLILNIMSRVHSYRW